MEKSAMTAVWGILIYVVLPLWVVCGFLDYLCHRASHMEAETGARESAIHWLMISQVGAPLLLAVFCQINALLILFMLLCLVGHEITGYFDLKLAMATRKVTIFEHQVHSALEILPLTAILLVLVLHWTQTEALFGFGPGTADFALRLKPPPGIVELTPPALLFVALILIPYLEETWRGLRARAEPPSGNEGSIIPDKDSRRANIGTFPLERAIGDEVD
jgi:hypothetical protein